MTRQELRAARIALGLTQKTMADLLQVTHRHMEQMESARPITPPHHAAAVAAMLSDPSHPARAVALHRLRVSIEEAHRRATAAIGAMEADPMGTHAVTALDVVTARLDDVAYEMEAVAP
ncbi:hypothetical protein [Iamia sp.]|uniref:hypothetical protein n=1 Tax=Iamia sp. TaxID=2722710 RepID=UPI002CA2BA76|nr:hypothetical protein [Iamia sp.]HXH56595.1 hypothetical protein [Iamia sp.]